MNEKERMLAGLMYDATDKELEKERFVSSRKDDQIRPGLFSFHEFSQS